LEGEGSSDFVRRHVAPNVQRPTRLRKVTARRAANLAFSIQNGGCRISFCHWTFSVRCWMFGVSVLISG
jgi:hypothetical protein